MSLRNLQKQTGIAPSKASQEAKQVTQAQPRGRGGGDRGYGGGRGGGAAGGGGGSYYSNRGTEGAGAGGGGYYQGGGAETTGGAGPSASSAPRVMAPTPGNRFNGTDAMRAHVEAIKKANRAEASAAPAQAVETVAVNSNLGLKHLEEKKQKEAEERARKREEARARRHNEETKKEVDDAQALAECEAQAAIDAQTGVKYEAALIVRIACKFGSAGVWLRIAEAVSRGADIPLEPKRIYLLAHPDKCRLEEASDATAILNAQRPPEMTEMAAKAASRPAAAAASAPPAEPAPPLDPETAAREARFAARRARAKAGPAGVGPADEPAAAAAEEERRLDPEDGQRCSFQELQAKYKDQYSPQEIQLYWDNDCHGATAQAAAAASREAGGATAGPSPPSAPAAATVIAEAVAAPVSTGGPAPTPVPGKNPRTKRY